MFGENVSFQECTMIQDNSSQKRAKRRDPFSPSKPKIMYIRLYIPKDVFPQNFFNHPDTHRHPHHERLQSLLPTS